MLIIPIKDGENIDRALKRFKRKFDKTGTKKSLQTRKEFVKPSIKRRAVIQKAQHVQRLRNQEDILRFIEELEILSATRETIQDLI